MRASIAIVLVAACGTDHQNHPLERCAFGQTLVAIRDGAGAWQMPQPTNGRYSMPVTGDYELVTVFAPGGTSNFVLAQEELGTAAEVAPIGACNDADPTTFPVTGKLAASGTVWLDGNGFTISSSPGDFSIEAHRGVHDLVVTTAYPDPNPAGRVSIQRALSVTGPQDVGTLDPATTGMPLMQVPLTVQNATGSVSTEVGLQTANGDFVTVSTSTTATASTIPSALLTSGDQQWLFVAAGQESAYAKFTGTQTTFTLPPPLTGITFAPDGTSASWTALPSGYDGVYMFLSASTVTQYVSATRGWIEHHGATSLAFATDVPGYDPSWIAASPTTGFSVWHDDGDVTYYSEASAPATARQLPRAPRLPSSARRDSRPSTRASSPR